MANSFKVIAVISAFNEGDIISTVIGHLVQNGIDVYLMDNHSTDDTVEQAAAWLGKGLLDIEKFPDCSDNVGKFDWTAILRRKEEVAATLQSNWFIHHDADEIRESPWPGFNLNEAIQWVDRLGYNCIDFHVLNFPPTDDGFRPGDDPRTYFKFCENAADFDLVRRNAWKVTGTKVALAAAGGHEARFPDRRVFPIKFLMRHYPIRGQQHGLKKVFRERKTRFLESERSLGWHVQYDTFVNESPVFIKDPGTLAQFDLDKTRLELMLPGELRRNFTQIQAERDELQQHTINLEAERDELRRHGANLVTERDSFGQHIVNIESELSSYKEHARSLKQEIVDLRQHSQNLETDRCSLKSHALNLEQEAAALREHADNLETERRSLKSHVLDLEQEAAALREHAENLETERRSLREHADNLENHASRLERELAVIHQSLAWRLLRRLSRLVRLKSP